MKKLIIICCFLALTFISFGQSFLSFSQIQKRTHHKNSDFDMSQRGVKLYPDSAYVTRKNDYGTTPYLGEKIYYEYNKSNGFLKSTYNITSLDGKKFVNNFKFTYTQLPNLFVQIKDGWNVAASKWVPRYKTIDSDFDKNGNAQSYYFEKWNTSTSKFDKDSYEKSTYNSLNYSTSYSYSSWDVATQKYLLSNFDSLYVFDAKGNPLQAANFDVENGEIIPNKKSIRTFDAQNRDLTWVDLLWSGSAWENSHKSTYTYNTVGNVEESIATEWEWMIAKKEWQLYAKSTYNVNDADKTVKYLYQKWNVANNNFENESNWEEKVDANTECPIYAKYSNWDKSANDFYLSQNRIYFCSGNILATNNIENKDLFSISPNPVFDILNLSLENVTDVNYTFTIFDSKGNLIQKNDFDSNNVQINVQKLSAGVYFLQLKNQQNVTTKKFVKL